MLLSRPAPIAAAIAGLLLTACPEKPTGPAPTDANPCGGVEGACDELDATRCSEDGLSMAVCEEDEDGCPVWVESLCGDHRSCDGSGATPECVCHHECEASTCDGTVLETCMADMDGCRFVVETMCFPSQTCVVDGTEAACECDNACTLDALQCTSATQIQLCALDAASCPRWQDSEEIDCPEHQGCTIADSAAVCGCLDPCDDGDFGCSWDTLQACATDTQGCRYWDDSHSCADEGALCDGDVTPAVCDATAFNRTAVGTPAWEFVALNQFFTPLASEEDLMAILAAVMPQHSPWSAHQPPYDSEIADAMEAAELVNHFVFRDIDFTAAKAEFFLVTIAATADAPQGSTPDFASGAHIPEALFPLSVAASLFFNDEALGSGEWQLAGLEGYDPGAAAGKAGVSHLHDYLFTFPPEEGSRLGDYRWEMQYRDTAGDGWDVVVKFRVKPVVEP